MAGSISCEIDRARSSARNFTTIASASPPRYLSLTPARKRDERERSVRSRASRRGVERAGRRAGAVDGLRVRKRDARLAQACDQLHGPALFRGHGFADRVGIAECQVTRGDLGILGTRNCGRLGPSRGAARARDRNQDRGAERKNHVSGSVSRLESHVYSSISLTKRGRDDVSARPCTRLRALPLIHWKCNRMTDTTILTRIQSEMVRRNEVQGPDT